MARHTRVPTLKARVSAQTSRLKTTAAQTETQTKRIMGRARQAIRRRHLQQEPLCVLCKKRGWIAAATQIDHVIPLWDGGLDDDSNRQGLCDDCHAKKTSDESARRSMIR
jgi:5-methylcytosine-specific restriction protein A